jgi:hypothetical protein
MRNYHYTAEENRPPGPPYECLLQHPEMPQRSSSPVEATRHDGSSQHGVQVFMAALAIFVKNCRAYPSNHPVVAASCATAVDLQAKALANQEMMTVGVAKGRFLIGKSAIESHNVQLQPFATLLHDHGIATVTFSRNVTAGDITSLARLLEEQPVRLWASGGPERFLTSNRVTSIRVTEVTSGLFRLRDGTEALPDYEEALDASLWEAMVRSLVDEGLVSGVGGDLPDVSGLARLLSAAGDSGADLSERLAAAEQSFLAALPPKLVVHSSRSLEKITAFVRELSPRLRNLFLMNLFGATPDRVDFVDALVTELPNEAIIDALKAADTRAYVPPMVQRLMARLATSVSHPEPVTGPADPKAVDKIRILLDPDRCEKYVPEAYRATLVSILSAETLPVPYVKEIRELKPTIDPRHIESRLADIIFEIAAHGPRAEMIEGLEQNLCEVADSYLQTGDFVSLNRLADRVEGLAAHPSAAPFVTGIRRHFASPGFADGLFDSLSIWGKEKRVATTLFIDKIGIYIVPALLDHLAIEENMSLRRYYMDRLAHLGAAARDAAIARLGDQRWFFVRNLIILLRLMNDPVGMEKIRSLSTHPHPRIREEVLKSFRHCGDAIGEEILLRELNCDDRERVLKAIQLAESSRSKAVLQKLLEMLSVATSRFAVYDLELKKAIVATLAAIGSIEALPRLEQILSSRNLLRPVLHSQMKVAIVKSLERYGAAEAQALLERIGRSTRGKPSKQAARMLQAAWRSA